MFIIVTEIFLSQIEIHGVESYFPKLKKFENSSHERMELPGENNNDAPQICEVTDVTPWTVVPIVFFHGLINIHEPRV